MQSSRTFQDEVAVSSVRATADDVSLVRLYVLRAMYLTLVIGVGALVLPALVSHPVSASGVQTCLLGGIWALAFIGIRYPLQMLPLLFFELAWKSMWMLDYGLPKISAGQLNADSAQDLRGTTVGVILMPLVIPWGYVWRNYVKRPGDRWK